MQIVEKKQQLTGGIMMNLFKRLVMEEEGQGMAEYGLILALVAVACIVGFQAIGNNLKTHLNTVGDSLK